MGGFFGATIMGAHMQNIIIGLVVFAASAFTLATFDYVLNLKKSGW